jgi:3-deoxy-D-manno-octulosonate 8-phosphate phosphatase (KDO 8-P phosphatase)
MPIETVSHHEIQQRATRVRLLLLDVDGVLTDGGVSIDSVGGEAKDFFIRDGISLVWARNQGIEVGLLSGRASAATTRRAAELGIQIVWQGGSDKRAGYAGILAAHGYTDADVAYMGDDLVDLPVLGRVGLATAPADAVSEVRTRVHWISGQPGGRGAVRELVELVLGAQGRWDAVLNSYLT